MSPILLRVPCLETPKAGSGPTNPRTEPYLASSSANSLPCTPACPGTQNRPTACRAEISFNALLALSDQRRHCSDGLKSFQSRLTIIADTHVFLRSILRLNFTNTCLNDINHSLKDCSVSSLQATDLMWKKKWHDTDGGTRTSWCAS